jgi:hypothetical protein
MDERSAQFRILTRLIRQHIRHGRFFCCAFFLRAASFSDVGMFPWQ